MQKIKLSKKEYTQLSNEFSYDCDIKPEIYRILKYEYHIEHSNLTEDEISDLVFTIQDEVYNLANNK
tara:strand:+ start:40 stop:240 length:201 start_codon:yes stop_codon:yes gene_type:complete